MQWRIDKCWAEVKQKLPFYSHRCTPGMSLLFCQTTYLDTKAKIFKNGIFTKNISTPPLKWHTYIEAAWRFESPVSWLHFDGILSSIGEINPSASSSNWSRKQRALKSVFRVTVRSGFVLLSSSEPSSSSWRCKITPVKSWLLFLALFHYKYQVTII